MRRKSASENLRENLGEIHKVSIGDLYRRFHSNPELGLTSEIAKFHLLQNGPNIITDIRKQSEFEKFIFCLFDTYQIVLWIAGSISIGYFIEKLIVDSFFSADTLFVAICLLITIFLIAYFRYDGDKTGKKIRHKFDTTMITYATVVRDGISTRIPFEDVVVGDIVTLRSGDEIPADIRLIESFELAVDHTSLTGEPEPKKRSTEVTDDNPLQTENLVFYTTSAMSGFATGIVFAVGNATLKAQLLKIGAREKALSTRLFTEVQSFIKFMAVVGFITGFIFFLFELWHESNPMEALLVGIGVLVANVPAGLIGTVTAGLTKSSKNLIKKHCLVRNVQTVESLGFISTICTDKTGTLTQNRLSVSYLWFDDEVFPIDSTENFKGSLVDRSSPAFDALARVAILCNRAEFEETLSDEPIYKRNIKGEAVDIATLKFFEATIGSVKNFKLSYPTVYELPIDTENIQFSIHLCEVGKHEGEHLLVVKAAPDAIAERCGYVYSHGISLRFGSREKSEFLRAIQEISSYGDRAFAFADFWLPVNKYPRGYEFSLHEKNFPLQELRLVGIIAMTDPARSTVPGAVSVCRKAGIRVVMITQDHPLTAKAFAKNVGIITPGTKTADEVAAERKIPISQVTSEDTTSIVVHGNQLNVLSADHLDRLMLTYTEVIFARTEPSQKVLIVESCQRIGSVVAATGDSVEDAVALRVADVGIAMGISGTDVAKHSADLVLLDDNFTSIVTGIEEGRKLLDNVKKSICFTLTSKVATMLPFFIYMLFSIPRPVGVVTVLCINVLADTIPALALAYEKPIKGLMLRKPTNPYTDKLINRRLFILTYVVNGILQASAGFLAYFVVMAEYGYYPETLYGILWEWDALQTNDLPDSYGQEWCYRSRHRLKCVAQTAFLAAVFECQCFNMVICRTRSLSTFRHEFTNYRIVIACVFMMLAAAALIYTPTNPQYFVIHFLHPHLWLPALPFCLLMIVVSEIRKFCIRVNPTGFVASETYY